MEFQEFKPRSSGPEQKPEPVKHEYSLTAKKQGKGFRVGTVTLGISLIAVGVMTVIHLVHPAFSLMNLRFIAPAVLILAGLEILVSAVCSKSLKLRYDVLSMVLCLLLVLGGTAMSVVPRLLLTSQNIRTATSRITTEIETMVYEALRDQEQIQEVRINYYLPDGLGTNAMEIQADTPYQEIENAHFSMDVILEKEYSSNSDFCKDVEPILKELRELELPEGYWSFRDTGRNYDIFLNSPWEHDFNAEQLEDLMD